MVSLDHFSIREQLTDVGYFGTSVLLLLGGNLASQPEEEHNNIKVALVQFFEDLLILVLRYFLTVSLDEPLVLHPDIFLNFIHFILALIQLI